MAKKRSKILGVVVTCVILTACLVALFIKHIHDGQILLYECGELHRVYAAYVRDHGGQLPNTFDDLIEDAYLRRGNSENADSLVGPPRDERDVIRGFPGVLLRHIDRFEISYSGDIGDFEVQDGLLYRRGTDSQIIFVRPHRSDLLAAAEEWTTTIYEKLHSPTTNSSVLPQPDPAEEPSNG